MSALRVSTRRGTNWAGKAGLTGADGTQLKGLWQHTRLKQATAFYPQTLVAQAYQPALRYRLLLNQPWVSLQAS